MQKITKLYIINIALVLTIIVATIMVHLLTTVNIWQYWFEIVVFSVGLCAMARAIVFHSDSNLWFSLVLLGVCGIMTMYQLGEFDMLKLWPMFVVVPALASLMVAVFYRDYMQLSICTLLSLLIVPMFLYSYHIVTLLVFIVLISACFVTESIITIMIFNRIKRIK